MGTILEVKNLKYKNILNNISFELEESSFNYLIGPNGSGKTTLVKCLAHLIDYEGQITYSNLIINDSSVDELRKHFGIVSDFNILLDQTVLYNITYPLINMGYNELESKKKAYSIIRKLKLNHIITKNINELSKSEQKLVLISSVLVYEPDVIIIDDYLDELDYKTKKMIINYLKKSKSTIIFVTNDQIDIDLSDNNNFLFINNGELIFKTAKEVMNEVNLFAKNNFNPPFMLDLTSKLKVYDLIKNVTLDKEKLVNKLWK